MAAANVNLEMVVPLIAQRDGLHLRLPGVGEAHTRVDESAHALRDTLRP